MFERNEKRKIRKFIYSWPMVVVLFILLGFAARGTWGVYAKYKESQANLETAERQYEATKKRADFLEREATRLSTDRGLEQEIRNRFQVARPGEHLVMIVGEEEKKPTEATTTVSKSWWQFWK